MIRQMISGFLREEDGLAAVEYAVIAGVVITGATALTTALFGADGVKFQDIGEAIAGKINSAAGVSTGGTDGATNP